MAPPFRRRRERAEADRAAQAEVDRLCALPRAELAVELMAAFGEDGPRARGLLTRGRDLIAVTEWLLRGHRRAGRHLLALAGPVREALRLLERAGLLDWRGSEVAGAKARLGATALGEFALARRTVRDYLGEDEEEEAPA